MRMNVTNEYTYTLETIVQAGRNKIPQTSVPIRTNEELRPSRLFNSMMGYVKKSMFTILRAFMMYQPLRFFTVLAIVPGLVGFGIGVRYIVFLCIGESGGHVQSLILASTLMLLGFSTYIMGLQADLIASNRKLLEDIQYHVRKLDYDGDTERKHKKDKHDII